MDDINSKIVDVMDVYEVKFTELTGRKISKVESDTMFNLLQDAFEKAADFPDYRNYN